MCSRCNTAKATKKGLQAQLTVKYHEKRYFISKNGKKGKQVYQAGSSNEKTFTPLIAPNLSPVYAQFPLFSIQFLSPIPMNYCVFFFLFPRVKFVEAADVIYLESNFRFFCFSYGTDYSTLVMTSGILSLLLCFNMALCFFTR